MLTVDYSRLGLKPGERVLDVGCGAGRHAAEARRLGAHVVALDRSDLDAKDAAGTLEAVTVDWPVARTVSGAAMVGDATRLPFPDASFDRVIAAEVFEHLPADLPAIAECTRVLKPGGTLAVTVPRWFPERVCWALSEGYHAVEGGHLRIYRRGVLTGRLAGAGLRVRDRHHAHGLHTPYWWLRCLVGAVGEDGIDDESNFWVRNYHRLLVWDIMRRPWITRTAERILDPVLGKSLVLYADKAA